MDPEFVNANWMTQSRTAETPAPKVLQQEADKEVRVDRMILQMGRAVTEAERQLMEIQAAAAA